MGEPWLWGNKEGEAFDQIKALLTNAPVMAYFTKDAKNPPSSRCLPCWTRHNLEKDGSYRPVYYASRKLSNVENGTPSSRGKQ